MHSLLALASHTINIAHMTPTAHTLAMIAHMVPFQTRSKFARLLSKKKTIFAMWMCASSLSGLLTWFVTFWPSSIHRFKLLAVCSLPAPYLYTLVRAIQMRGTNLFSKHPAYSIYNTHITNMIFKQPTCALNITNTLEIPSRERVCVCVCFVYLRVFSCMFVGLMTAFDQTHEDRTNMCLIVDFPPEKQIDDQICVQLLFRNSQKIMFFTFLLQLICGWITYYIYNNTQRKGNDRVCLFLWCVKINIIIMA